MATYYPQYYLQPSYTFPTTTEWIPTVNTIQTSSLFYSTPISTLLPTSQVVTQICPCTGVLVAEPTLTSVLQSPILTEAVTVSNLKEPFMDYSPNVSVPSSSADDNKQTYAVDEASMNLNAIQTIDEDVDKDPIEYYLSLPKELFPTARMFSLDPNPMIDEFCKMGNISDNTSWILDLEFGIPRAPVTRTIPTYDVQFNSIHCKNTPGAIHPGFESCSQDFKKVLLFYYDCIASTWYKGYVDMNHDKSVENFQSWLLLPMRIFGMCWP